MYQISEWCVRDCITKENCGSRSIYRNGKHRITLFLPKWSSKFYHLDSNLETCEQFQALICQSSWYFLVIKLLCKTRTWALAVKLIEGWVEIEINFWQITLKLFWMPYRIKNQEKWYRRVHLKRAVIFITKSRL